MSFINDNQQLDAQCIDLVRYVIYTILQIDISQELRDRINIDVFDD